jgi:putative two-component system response regulator
MVAPVLSESARSKILIVDDSVEHLLMLHGLLRHEYATTVAANGTHGFELASASPTPDLVLLDVHMPDLNGYDLCRRLKAHPETAGIPVIFITADQGDLNEERGLLMGAVDYITKPFSPSVVRARVRTHLAQKQTEVRLRRQASELKAEVRRRTAELLRGHELTIHAVASIVEARDNETGGHIRRTQIYVRVLAKSLGEDPQYTQVLSDELIDLLHKTAPLHDIGKVGIPDEILRKPGPLTDEEFEVVKTHTVIGRDALARVEAQEGGDIPFLQVAKELTMSHHERWDGTGYPEGKRGTNIPLSARLMAVADTYDAIRSDRVYRAALSHEYAVHVIESQRGTHFEPAIVDAFHRVADIFDAIARSLPDA